MRQTGDQQAMTNTPAQSNAVLAEARSADLLRNALELLEANSLGQATRPGPLYPHQWSWDAAAIAMGRAQWDQARAEQELRSLFAGQWSDGMLPHIVFSDSERYFPGPAFWQTERSANAPAGVRTSGIVQPPIHATAAWRLYLRSADRERADAFLRELFPQLVAWHEYLYRERARGDDGLVEVRHPWETGMDNSPAWDAALGRIELAPEQIPDYERIDIQLAKRSERPSDFEYDRYAYLVALFRELDYDAARIRDACPFAIQPVLFNSLLIQSNRDLARIAEVLGTDPEPARRWAQQTAAGLERLWDEDRSAYVDYDVLADAHVEHETVARFAPLYAGVPSPARAAEIVEQLLHWQAGLAEDLLAVPSVAPDDPCFEPALYWRGPVWPIYQWVLQHGVDRYGHPALAERLRRTTLELAQRGGLWEHYSPIDGHGQGDPHFSWTAGLVLDLLARPARIDADET
jgi:Trehalase